MAELRSHSEPSMEEILASIRRIIVEDDGPPSKAAASQKAPPPASAAAGAAGVRSPGENWTPGQAPPLRVAGSQPVVRTFPPVQPGATPQQPTRSPPVQEAILDLTERIDDDDLVHRAAEPIVNPSSSTSGRLNQPPPLKGGTPGSAAAPAAPPRMASDAALAASVATLTKIAGIGQAARQPELPLGDVGRTLEEMVRELLRPPMKEWLDANLPRLVERLVRDEIARLIRDVQER
jgi:uncharacterized protein